MPKAYPRRVANLLLRFAIRITPSDTLDWAQAMLSELSHVQGDWTALLWAVGGASVLAKHALLSLVIHGHNRQTVPSGGELFAREGPMRKAALAAVGSCIVLSMLFFLAPAFRQAFQVSLAQWHFVLHVAPQYGEPGHGEAGLEALARRAEQKHDAEGLAFVAVRHWDELESARLADEAVNLDPKLTWIYAVVAVRNPELPEINRWVPKLEQWDPQNALPHFITAESIDIDQVVRENVPHRVDEESQAWQNALAAAFQSPKLDTYCDRLKELDRRVLLRYGIDDPYQAIGYEYRYCLPSFTAWDSSRYAKSLLESGEILEARGDRKGALEKYWNVARFGHMIDPAAGSMMSQTLQGAYKRLEALSQREGSKQQAELYAYLAGKIDQAEEEESASLRQRVTGGAVSRWNATVVRVSGLMMLFFGGLLVICALTVTARGQSMRLRSVRASPLTVAFGLGGAIGLLLSNSMLYVSYRPYADIFQRFIRTGDESRIRELSEFLDYTLVPLGVQRLQNQLDFVFYFWLGVTVLFVIALLLVVLRGFYHRPRAKASI